MFGWFHRRRLGRAFLFVPFLLAAPVAIAAFGGPGPFCGMRPPQFDSPEQALAFAVPMLERVASQLDLSPDQRTTVDAIVQESVRELWDVRSRGEQVREAMAKAIKAGDEGRVEQLRQQGLELADEGSAIMLRRVLEVREVLTPAQREKMEKLREDWHGR
jgi:Spy/CpxP family protein refolding chaperone